MKPAPGTMAIPEGALTGSGSVRQDNAFGAARFLVDRQTGSAFSRTCSQMPLTDYQVMNRPAKPAVTSLQLFEPDPAIVYPLDAVEHLTQLPRRTILVYCRHGLVSPVMHPESGGYYFTGDAIRELRWIGYLQLDCGVNVTGIKLILNLTGELRRLRATIAMVPNSTRHPHQCWGINE